MGYHLLFLGIIFENFLHHLVSHHILFFLGHCGFYLDTLKYKHDLYFVIIELNFLPLACSLQKSASVQLYLLNFYQRFPNGQPFFKEYFHKLIGNYKTMEQIKAGLTEEEIRKTWEPGLQNFKEIRKKYLLYPDFE